MKPLAALAAALSATSGALTPPAAFAAPTAPDAAELSATPSLSPPALDLIDPPLHAAERTGVVPPEVRRTRPHWVVRANADARAAFTPLDANDRSLLARLLGDADLDDLDDHDNEFFSNAALDLIESTAAHAERDDPNRAARLRYQAALQLQRVAPAKSRELLHAVVERTPDHPRAMAVLRIAATGGLLPEAETMSRHDMRDALRRAVVHFETRAPEVQALVTFDYKNVAQHYAETLASLGDDETAIRVRNSLLYHDWLPLDDDEIQRLVLENARSYKRLGDRASAANSYDALLNAFPSLGADDGSRVHLFMERAEVAGERRLDPDHLAALEDILHNPDLQSFRLQLSDVAMTLAVGHAGKPAEAAERFEAVRTIVRDIRSAPDFVALPTADQRRLNTHHATALNSLVLLYRPEMLDRPDALDSAQAELRKLFPNHPTANLR